MVISGQGLNELNWNAGQLSDDIAPEIESVKKGVGLKQLATACCRNVPNNFEQV